MDPVWWSRRPAVRAVLLLIAGILMAGIFRPRATPLFCAAAATLIMVSLVRCRGGATTWTNAGLHLLLVLLGLLITTMRRSQIEADILSPENQGERIVIDGRIESEPVKKGSRSEMILRSSFVRRGQAGSEMDRRILVQVVRSARWEEADSLEIGDAVRISGYLESLPGARNPGEFDYGRYLALNGVQGFLTVRDTNTIQRQSKAASYELSDLIGIAQKNIYKTFDRFHATSESSFLKGVVFGFRGDLTAEMKQAFMDTGTIHILAVSGSNVVFVALVFSSLVGFLRVSHRAATALTLLGLIWYMVITGLSPSVIRATIMACSILIASVIGRKGEIYNSVAFAAFLMLMWDPMYLLDVGFLLSFAAVLSIVYFYPKLEDLLKFIPKNVMKVKFVDPTLKLFAVSIAAQLGTLPFTAYYFSRVSLISVLANLLVVPLSGLNTILGFATIAFSFVSDGVASCYAALNDLLVSFLLKFVLWCANVPYAYVDTAGVGAPFAIAYYAILLALFNARHTRVLVNSLLTCLMLLNVYFYSEVVAPATPLLTVTVIDVGQGDAILLEFPNKKYVLLDTGPRYPSSDMGQRTILPLLRRKGIQSLDAIVLSHAHDDHTGGCRYLLENIAVGRLIVADTTVKTRPFAEALEAARQHDIPVTVTRAGQCLQFDPSTRIFVLHPGAELPEGDLNNRSLVLKVLYGTSSILLPGDASGDVEDRLLQKCRVLLSTGILKVAHHGASTSSGDRFLQEVRPSLAIISVGRLNKFNHPSPVTLSRYQRWGIRTVRTDFDGAAVLKSDGKRFELVSWRQSGLI